MSYFHHHSNPNPFFFGESHVSLSHIPSIHLNIDNEDLFLGEFPPEFAIPTIKFFVRNQFSEPLHSDLKVSEIYEFARSKLHLSEVEIDQLVPIRIHRVEILKRAKKTANSRQADAKRDNKTEITRMPRKVTRDIECVRGLKDSERKQLKDFDKDSYAFQLFPWDSLGFSEEGTVEFRQVNERVREGWELLLVLPCPGCKAQGILGKQECCFNCKRNFDRRAKNKRKASVSEDSVGDGGELMDKDVELPVKVKDDDNGSGEEDDQNTSKRRKKIQIDQVPPEEYIGSQPEAYHLTQCESSTGRCTVLNMNGERERTEEAMPYMYGNEAIPYCNEEAIHEYPFLEIYLG